jgi:AmpE protein
MTVLIVLAGLLISHLATAVGRWRNFDWLLWPIVAVRSRFPGNDWLPMVMVLLVGILVPVLAVWLVTALLGTVGWVLLALAAFIYTLGPRDLDQDVATLHAREAPEDVAHLKETAEAMQLDLDAGAGEAAAAVFHGALSRWFGILLWFVVLGIPGAVLYRLNRTALQLQELDHAELDWLARMRIVLDWPVQALMMLGVALCGDLDRVWKAWQELREERPAWLITPVQLDRIAEAIVPEGASFDEGLAAGHRMMWRVLILWLVVMSVLLLAGLLA